MDGIPVFLADLKSRFGEKIEEMHAQHGDATAVVRRDAIVEVCAWLRDDDKTLFDLFLDLTAVDYIGRKPRFEVVIHLVSIPLNHRLRLKVRLEEDDPAMPTIIPVYPASNWFERECWDLYGIKFDGHPDLRRMFLQESFVGHPLRKDYPIAKRQPLIKLRKPEVRRSDESIEPRSI